MIKRFLLPVFVVVVGVGLAIVIVITGPKLEPQPPTNNAPLVRTGTAEDQTVQLTSITHGTVLPRTESELIPEVSGRVIGISPTVVSGGFFRKDDLLLEIDPLDYEVALEQARAGLASARSELTNANKAHERQLDLAKRQSTSQSQKDDALNRLRFAQASLRESKARLSRAERDLARTRITAPYDGRVRSERVDIGQFVNRGSPIASLYATDVAEVRLPIHDEELAHLDLPLAGATLAGEQPIAILRARFAGEEHTWEGLVVRTEGELDPRTRMINVIAQVQSPYEQQNGRPPLAVGLFVEAEIIGHQVSNVFVLPRSALQLNRQVYVVGNDNRLQFRDVDILRTVGEEVYVTDGIRRGEILCMSIVNNAVEGMLVQPIAESAGLVSS
ncbi:MAG: efflux RND transporter periplasmic adaptor subunit [Gammaproteobacteria bacterium]|nr:efflux RND transporter periplasmic adaptor subunit [Gammaproteobacteria bacterium]MBT4494897.1 efflux RND transporter periplasmic adaptor subunit [Gammaproteobacteria bacterium]MBT7371875.1 efflux RND transporter periplasmic adaptor subunit [Gammaproteobacteria bacterium]